MQLPLHLYKPHITFENLPGGHSAGEPPDPIPNSVVKPGHVDDTAWAAVWESRSPPGSYSAQPQGWAESF